MHRVLSVSVVAPVATVALLGIAGSRTTAWAQAPTDPREQARSHVGPFYVTPTLKLQEAGVDTNVFNTATSEKADFTATLVPHADVWVPLGQRGLLTLSGTLPLVYYQTYASERAVNPDVALRGDLRLNRISFFTAATYSNSRSRPNLEIDTRARHEQTGVEAGLSLQLAPRLSLDASAFQTDVAFDEDATFNSISLRDTLNRHTRAATTALRYDVTPLTRVFVRGQLIEDRFVFSPVRDADSVAIMPGVEFQPRALISGSAAVGVRRFRPTHPAVPDHTGVVVAANLSYAFRSTTRVRVTATRDLAYSYSDAQPYYRIGGVGLLVSRHLGGRFDVTAGGDWETHRYRRRTIAVEPLPIATPPMTPGPIVPLTATVNHLRMWSASVGYRFARSQRLGLGASYRERNSNSTELNSQYSGFRFMATVDSEL